jgi:hypothetical protein
MDGVLGWVGRAEEGQRTYIHGRFGWRLDLLFWSEVGPAFLASLCFGYERGCLPESCTCKETWFSH